MKYKTDWIFRLLIVLTILFGCKGTSNAQGYTLQFSKVVLVTNILQTVPANKVWKVEKLVTGSFSIYQYSTGNCSGSNSDPYQIFIDGSSYFLDETISTGQSSYQYVPGSTPGALWLPAGTTLKTQCPSTLISIIEFNLIQ